jgi:hypothetical protein
MKKILLLILLTSLLISQQPKKGIGFEFHTMPTAFLIGETGSSMGVYFPFETASNLFLEPLIAYSSSSSERDYDDYYNSDYENSLASWGISLGIFKSTYSNKMRTYFGIRVGKVWTKEEQTGYDDAEYDALIISPTFGAEYFINENFSFGGEAMYSMLSSENESENNNYTNENNYTDTDKISMIIPKFMVRFYY